MGQTIPAEVPLPVVAEVFRKVYNLSPGAQKQDELDYRHAAASFFTDLYFGIRDNLENPKPWTPTDRLSVLPGLQ